jgi:hypothetical protein
VNLNNSLWILETFLTQKCSEGLKAEGLEEWGRGRRQQGVDLFYSCDAAAVPHGARTLPLWGTTLGLLTPWATTLGFLPPCPATARIWPHRVVQPTVVATPNVVPHGGRNSCRCGVWREMYISRNFWFDHLFFEN